MAGLSAPTHKQWRRVVLVVVGLIGVYLEVLWCQTELRHGSPQDLWVYREAAKNFLHGGAPYMMHFGRAHLPFMYPPFALLCFTVLALVSTLSTTILWWLVSMAALWWLCARALSVTTALGKGDRYLVGAVVAVISTMALEPLRSTIGFGQISFLLLALVAADILADPLHWRGIRTGIASAIKLTPLTYIPGLVLARDRRAGMRALAIFLGASALGWVIYPKGSVTFWVHQAIKSGHEKAAHSAQNQSEFGLVHVLISSGVWATVAWLVMVALTLVGGYWCVRSYFLVGRKLEALVVLALIEVLVSPLSETHHWALVVLLPILGVARWRSGRGVSLACWLVTLVAVAWPYHWQKWGWYGHDAWRVLPGFSLALSGIILLVTMVTSQWSERTRALGEDIDTQSPDNVPNRQ